MKAAISLLVLFMIGPLPLIMILYYSLKSYFANRNAR
jgi:hypothetical protein